MNPTLICAEAAQEMLPLAAVVLYDHYESGCRAKALLEQVAANTGGGIPFSLALWRMDCLAYPGISTEVFGDLGRSTMLVLSLGTGGEVPNSIFALVECWAHCWGGDDSALLVLGNAGPAAVEKLGKIAERRGITLFCQQATQGWQSYGEGVIKREQILTPILEETLGHSHSGYSHWGLNE